MLLQLLLRTFFLPGDLVCNACGVEGGDNRMMIRTLVDMLFWNLVVVLAVVIFFM